MLKRYTSSLRFLCVWLLASLAGAAESSVAIDQWYQGEINAQPAVSLHIVSTMVEGGGRSTVSEMAMVIQRKFGEKRFRVEVRERQELSENGQGQVTKFRFDKDENGSRSSAFGTIVGTKLVADLARLGRIERQELTIPEGTEILGPTLQQERIAASFNQAQGAPSPVTFHSIELIGNRIALVRSTATYKATDADGHLVFSSISDMLPLPTTIAVTARGELVSMGIEIGPFKVSVHRAAGPVALLGGEINSDSLVRSAGIQPRGGAVERYRMPVGASVVSDEFQQVEMDVLTVHSEAAPSSLADRKPFLAKETQLETDDAELRNWVDGIITGRNDGSDVAEALRLAVRTHITTRDLTVADGSALETFRNRKGDCTEHANLLCAALRIAGIPARVDIGLVFTVDIDPPAWCGHAWVSAWVEGRWVALDAAIPGKPRSQYIRLGSANGEDGVRTNGMLLAAMASLMGGDRQIEGLGAKP